MLLSAIRTQAVIRFLHMLTFCRRLPDIKKALLQLTDAMKLISVLSNQGRRSHRITGGHKRRLGVPQWGPGAEPRRGSGEPSPPEAEAFCETTHNICIKIRQTTVVAVTG